MFRAIANLWREARGDGLRKEVADVLDKLSQAHTQVQAISYMAFLDALVAVQHEFGPTNNLSNDRRRELAKKLQATARQRYNDNVGGSYGLFLMSAYLEASALPGRDAQTALEMVTQYHLQAQAIQDVARRGGN